MGSIGTSVLGLLWVLSASVSGFAAAQLLETAKIDQFIAAKYENQRFNGNILIARHGKVLYEKSFGYADLYTKKPLYAQATFDIASITKEMTAAAVLLSRDRGLLSLDDKLESYYPQLPYRGITIRELLTHTSGLPEQNEIMFKEWTSSAFATNQDLIAMLVRLKLPPHFAPGENFEYCNTNYSILAGVVEKVTGKSFREFLQTNIFTPLHMRHTFVTDRTNPKFTMPASEVPDFLF